MVTKVDLIALGFVALTAFIGWKKGLVASALSLAGIVLGAWLGSRLAPQLLQGGTRSPYTPAFWWNLGRMHLYFAERGDGTAKNAAYETMRRAIAAAPQNPDTFDQFARIQLALEDLAGALESSQKAIALYPGEPKYYTVAGDAARRGPGSRARARRAG